MSSIPLILFTHVNNNSTAVKGSHAGAGMWTEIKAQRRSLSLMQPENTRTTWRVFGKSRQSRPVSCCMLCKCRSMISACGIVSLKSFMILVPVSKVVRHFTSLSLRALHWRIIKKRDIVHRCSSPLAIHNHQMPWALTLRSECFFVCVKPLESQGIRWFITFNLGFWFSRGAGCSCKYQPNEKACIEHWYAGDAQRRTCFNV